MTDRTCSVDGCERRSRARGLCTMHYQRWWSTGNVELHTRAIETCSVEGCPNPARTRSWCSKHYARWSRFGDLAGRARPRRSVCSIAGCGSQSQARGLCPGHYSAWRYKNIPGLAASKSRRRRAQVRSVHSEPYSTIEIADRDGWVCQLCRKRIGRKYQWSHLRSLSIDHIIPISLGGDDVKSNVQAAHLGCNISKHNRGTDQLRLIG